jgi:hypothetical protein
MPVHAYRFALLPRFAAAGFAFLLLAACAGGDATAPGTFSTAAPVPPAVPASAIAGRWGLGAYHRDEDRTRVESTARQTCNQPYVIAQGPTGGVIMHLADQREAEELQVKGAPGGKTFVGPAGEPGGPQDREVLSYDGQVMIMRWMDPEITSRYGTLVFARCPEGRPATAARPPASRPAPARKGQ